MYISIIAFKAWLMVPIVSCLKNTSSVAALLKT